MSMEVAVCCRLSAVSFQFSPAKTSVTCSLGARECSSLVTKEVNFQIPHVIGNFHADCRLLTSRICQQIVKFMSLSILEYVINLDVGLEFRGMIHANQARGWL